MLELPPVVEYYESGSHSAEAVIARLSVRARAKVYAYLDYLGHAPRRDIKLKKTTFDELWEKKYDLPEGGLRILFALGSGGRLWCIGAFLKRNDKEGNRLLKHPYEKLAIEASRR